MRRQMSRDVSSHLHGHDLQEGAVEIAHLPAQVVKLIEQQQDDRQGVFVDLHFVAHFQDQAGARHVDLTERVAAG